MEPVVTTISAWDGLALCVRTWDGGPARTPVLALPGIVRTSGDFGFLAPYIAKGRRMVSLDYAGRGASGRSRNVSRYAAEACVRDVLDVCSALHLHRVIVIGTSFGGLLAMGLAIARPALLRGVVLNDIGPEIGSAGAAFVRDFVGRDPALRDISECVALLRRELPPMSLENDLAWRQMAELTFAQAADGRYRPLWDVRIAALLRQPAPDLWPLFGALAHVPLLLVRGGVSTILLPQTVARMQAQRPDMRVVTLPDIGHAPILTEPEALAAIIPFLDAAA